MSYSIEQLLMLRPRTRPDPSELPWMFSLEDVPAEETTRNRERRPPRRDRPIGPVTECVSVDAKVLLEKRSELRRIEQITGAQIKEKAGLKGYTVMVTGTSAIVEQALPMVEQAFSEEAEKPALPPWLQSSSYAMPKQATPSVPAYKATPQQPIGSSPVYHEFRTSQGGDEDWEIPAHWRSPTAQMEVPAAAPPEKSWQPVQQDADEGFWDELPSASPGGNADVQLGGSASSFNVPSSGGITSQPEAEGAVPGRWRKQADASKSDVKAKAPPEGKAPPQVSGGQKGPTYKPPPPTPSEPGSWSPSEATSKPSVPTSGPGPPHKASAHKAPPPEAWSWNPPGYKAPPAQKAPPPDRDTDPWSSSKWDDGGYVSQSAKGQSAAQQWEVTDSWNPPGYKAPPAQKAPPPDRDTDPWSSSKWDDGGYGSQSAKGQSAAQQWEVTDSAVLFASTPKPKPSPPVLSDDRKDAASERSSVSLSKPPPPVTPGFQSFATSSSHHQDASPPAKPPPLTPDFQSGGASSSYHQGIVLPIAKKAPPPEVPWDDSGAMKTPSAKAPPAPWADMGRPSDVDTLPGYPTIAAAVCPPPRLAAEPSQSPPAPPVAPEAPVAEQAGEADDDAFASAQEDNAADSAGAAAAKAKKPKKKKKKDKTEQVEEVPVPAPAPVVSSSNKEPNVLANLFSKTKFSGLGESSDSDDAKAAPSPATTSGKSKKAKTPKAAPTSNEKKATPKASPIEPATKAVSKPSPEPSVSQTPPAQQQPSKAPPSAIGSRPPPPSIPKAKADSSPSVWATVSPAAVPPPFQPPAAPSTASGEGIFVVPKKPPPAVKISLPAEIVETTVPEVQSSPPPVVKAKANKAAVRPQPEVKALDPLPQRSAVKVPKATLIVNKGLVYASDNSNAASGLKWQERPVERLQPGSGYYEEEEDPDMQCYLWDRRSQRPKQEPQRPDVKAQAPVALGPPLSASRAPPPPAKQRTMLLQVMDMGFDEPSAKRALTSSGWVSVEAAVTLLLG